MSEDREPTLLRITNESITLGTMVQLCFKWVIACVIVGAAFTAIAAMIVIMLGGAGLAMSAVHSATSVPVVGSTASAQAPVKTCAEAVADANEAMAGFEAKTLSVDDALQRARDANRQCADNAQIKDVMERLWRVK